MARLSLKAISAVLKGSTALSASDRALARSLETRAEQANAQLDAANTRVWNLPSARPGHEGQSVAVATLTARETLPKSEGVFFSRRRLETSEGIEDLANWAPLSGDAVRAEGSRNRQMLSRLGATLREQFGPGHEARRLYAELTQLDSQATFVLGRTGFFERLRGALGDEDRGMLDTKNLTSLFTEEPDGGSQWAAIIQELRNARQYNRRVMGAL